MEKSEELLPNNQTHPHMPIPHIRFEPLTFVHNCVKDILELICTDLHVLKRRGIESWFKSTATGGAEALQNESQLSMFIKSLSVLFCHGVAGPILRETGFEPSAVQTAVGSSEQKGP